MPKNCLFGRNDPKCSFWARNPFWATTVIFFALPCVDTKKTPFCVENNAQMAFGRPPTSPRSHTKLLASLQFHPRQGRQQLSLVLEAPPIMLAIVSIGFLAFGEMMVVIEMAVDE